MPWRDDTSPKIYIVIKRNGDGYHSYAPDLLAAYFDESIAREHAQKEPEYDYEEVPLAPQVVP